MLQERRFLRRLAGRKALTKDFWAWVILKVTRLLNALSFEANFILGFIVALYFGKSVLRRNGVEFCLFQQNSGAIGNVS